MNTEVMPSTCSVRVRTFFTSYHFITKMFSAGHSAALMTPWLSAMYTSPYASGVAVAPTAYAATLYAGTSGVRMRRPLPSSGVRIGLSAIM